MRSKEEKWEAAVRNIRARWPEETKKFSNHAIACMWEDFYFSDDYGNNDEKLPDWFYLLPDYQAIRNGCGND